MCVFQQCSLLYILPSKGACWKPWRSPERTSASAGGGPAEATGRVMNVWHGPENLRGLVLFLMNFFVYFSVELKPQGRHNEVLISGYFTHLSLPQKKAHFRMTKTDQYAFHSAQWGQELLTREGVARLRQIKAFGGNEGGRSGWETSGLMIDCQVFVWFSMEGTYFWVAQEIYNGLPVPELSARKLEALFQHRVCILTQRQFCILYTVN